MLALLTCHNSSAGYRNVSGQNEKMVFMMVVVLIHFNSLIRHFSSYKRFVMNGSEKFYPCTFRFNKFTILHLYDNSCYSSTEVRLQARENVICIAIHGLQLRLSVLTLKVTFCSLRWGICSIHT